MQAIGSASRFLLPPLHTGCPTPPLSPPIDGPSTPTPTALCPAFVDDEAEGMRTPRASQCHAPRLAAHLRPLIGGPVPINAVDQALAAPRNQGPTVIYADRPRLMPKGKKAHASLLAALKSAQRERVEAVMARLGEARTVFGVRYDHFAVVRLAASSPARLGCLKVILRALPDDDVRGLMRTHSGLLCDAAQAADDIDYANWLIYAFGHDALQYISER